MADTTDIGGIAVKGLLVKWFAIFMTGGLIYYFLEIAVRHYSHYSMILCGGMATLLCGGLNQTFKRMSVLLQMVCLSTTAVKAYVCHFIYVHI